MICASDNYARAVAKCEKAEYTANLTSESDRAIDRPLHHNADASPSEDSEEDGFCEFPTAG